MSWTKGVYHVRVWRFVFFRSWVGEMRRTSRGMLLSRVSVHVRVERTFV